MDQKRSSYQLRFIWKTTRRRLCSTISWKKLYKLDPWHRMFTESMEQSMGNAVYLHYSSAQQRTRSKHSDWSTTIWYCLEKDYTRMTEISWCGPAITMSESSHPRMEWDAWLLIFYLNTEYRRVNIIIIHITFQRSTLRIICCIS